MQINIEKQGNVCILKCLQNIDSESYGDLKNIFDKLIKENNLNIIVDLSKVSFIGSSGWGVFIGSLQKVRLGGGDIRLCGMTEDVKNIYETVNFNEFLRSYDTLEEAIESFK